MKIAIGLALTGTMNSPSSSLAFLYPNSTSNGVNHPASRPRKQLHPLSTSQASPAFTNSTRPSPPTNTYNDSPQSSFNDSTGQSSYSRGLDTGGSYGPNILPWSNYPNSNDPPGLHQNKTNSAPGGRYTGPMNPQAFSGSSQQPNLYRNSSQESHYPQTRSGAMPAMNFSAGGGAPEVSHFGDMTIESQDIDMSALGNEMMPLFEYLPQDFLNNLDVGDANIYPQQQLSPNSTVG